MSVTFRKEPFGQVFDEAKKRLLQRHYDEIAENKHVLGAPDPDEVKYKLLEDLGMLHAIAARDGSELVGYFTAVVDTNLHYRTVRVGQEDAYYLVPEHRRGRTGFQLLIAAEGMMRELGAEIGIARTKVANDKGPVLERLGWRPFEKIYCKVMR